MSVSSHRRPPHLVGGGGSGGTYATGTFTAKTFQKPSLNDDDFLVIILDINPLSWLRLHQQVSPANDTSSSLMMTLVWDQVLVFINAFLSLKSRNRVAVIGSSSKESRFIYPKKYAPVSAMAAVDPSINHHGHHFHHHHHHHHHHQHRHNHEQARFSQANDTQGSQPQLPRRTRRRAVKEEGKIAETFAAVDDAIVKSLKAMMEDALKPVLEASSRPNGARDTEMDIGDHKPFPTSQASSTSTTVTTEEQSNGSDISPAQIEKNVRQAGWRETTLIGSALSRSLSYINKVCLEDPLRTVRARILIVSVSGDSTMQYIPIMNGMFCAQKKEIPIDTCQLGDINSTFLQQASHETSGIYLNVARDRLNVLLEYLMASYLMDSYSRQFMNFPMQSKVDFRAACFCHRRVIDIGYVCSVCLSIFCERVKTCMTCGSDITSSTRQRVT